MESVWLLLDGGRDAVRRPGLGFLGTSRFAAKTLGFGGWKSLDFLGFSRPNRALSMGYTGFSLEKISRALWAAGAARLGYAPAVLACRRAGLDMGRA